MALKDRRFPAGPYVRTVDGNPPDANGDVASSGTGGGGGGSATGQAFVAVDPSKHLPDSTVGTWARSTTASAEVYLVSSGTQNDEAVWSLPLGPGTYDLKLAFSRDTNRGIVTVAVDDGAGAFTTLTTVDTYGAGDLQVVTVTGLVIAGSALRRQVRLKMATKNASSSAYYLTVHGFSWTLTSTPASGSGGGPHAATHAAGGTDPVTLAQSQITGLVTDLAAKAPLASPALTGNPTAPTPTAGDNDTSIATTAFVQTALQTPWLIEMDLFMPPATATTWSTWVAGGRRPYLSTATSGTIQGSQIGWDIVLGAGTWVVDLMFWQGTDRGITTIALDGTSVATVDQYGSGGDAVQASSASFTVATTKKYRVTLTQATKNASSSNYISGLQAVQFRRTA